MRLPWLLCGLAFALAAVVAAAVWSGVGAAPQSVPHPDYPSLLRAADGAARIAPVAALGAVFGGLQIAFFGACFALGMRRGGSLGPVARPLWIGLLLYEGGFGGLLYGYWRYLGDPSLPLVGSFPLPTAVLLYVLWPLPLFFAWIYLRHFDDWVVDEAEVERVLALAPRDPEPDRPEGP
jgi:hypothetical protein